MPAVLKCPCHGIILDGTLETLLYFGKITEKQAGRITANYSVGKMIQTYENQ